MLCRAPLASHRRVLLVDDDPDIRAVLATALRTGGYQVTELGDGLELYNQLGACLFDGDVEPDAIVSDLRLPFFDGLEVLASVHHTDLEIPFILITAYGDEAMRAEAHRLGAAAVLDKPLDFDLLLETLGHCRPERAPS
jgi:DNA-binding NtrC family response regulator